MKSLIKYSTIFLIFISCWDSVSCINLSHLFPNKNSTPSKKYSEDTGAEDERPDLIRPRSNFWELVSSSADMVPLRNGSTIIKNSEGATLPFRLNIETRLQKLEFDFNMLKIYEEDCRQRLLCEMAENPLKFAPLSTALLEETSYNGDEKALSSGLLATNEGARLLTYIEASQKGFARSGCGVWTYRCPQTGTSMIDYKALLIWKELYKWLTVKFVAKRT